MSLFKSGLKASRLGFRKEYTPLHFCHTCVLRQFSTLFLHDTVSGLWTDVELETVLCRLVCEECSVPALSSGQH